MDNQQILHIIDRVKKGDYDAFTHLVDTHKDMVYSLCFKMTMSTEDAEEIAQDAFLKAYQGLYKFKGNSKFSTWLYQITYYTIINFLRKKKMKTGSDFSEANLKSDASVLEEIQQSERKKYIDQTLEHLNPNERAIITLYYLDEQRIEEIALITKLSEANVKVKLHRTRKKMYGILQKLLKNELNSLVQP